MNEYRWKAVRASRRVGFEFLKKFCEDLRVNSDSANFIFFVLVRLGKLGLEPSSEVKIDSKYSFKIVAFSSSVVIILVPCNRTNLRQNRRDMIKAIRLGHNACKGILNKLEAGQVGNRCASEERIAVIKPWSNYSRRHCLSCISGERWSNVAQGTDVDIWRFTCFR